MPLNIAVHRSPSQAAVSSRVTGGQLEICLYATVGAGEGEISWRAFKAILDRHAGKYRRITLRVNSHAGDTKHGQSIRRQLLRTGKPIRAEIEGIAGTAAALVATAAASITMGVGACMVLDSGFQDQAVLRAFAERSGQSRETIAGLLAQETLLGAEECLKFHLADRIA
jgi:ATP-dependent protease ClpP protease subunit